MKVVIVFVFAIIFNYAVAQGKPVTSGNASNQTCSQKQVIKNVCDSTKRDMQALFHMVFKRARLGGQSRKLPTTKNMFSTFSTVKKLGKDKIVERLYFFHNILGDGYGFFGKAKSRQMMKTKTINIVIQIKALAEILQNNTSCNPGKPGRDFKFTLPKDKAVSGSISAFLYHFASLLKQMQQEFEDNVIQQLKFI